MTLIPKIKLLTPAKQTLLIGSDSPGLRHRVLPTAFLILYTPTSARRVDCKIRQYRPVNGPASAF